MSVIQAHAIAGGGYQIPHSLRLRASASAYLSRTFAAGSNNKMAWSGWVKNADVGLTYPLSFIQGGDGTQANANADGMLLSSFGKLMVYAKGGVTGAGGWSREFAAQYRDPSAWMHIFVLCDLTNGTVADKIQLWVSGLRVTAYSDTGTVGTSFPYLNTSTTASAHLISRLNQTGGPSYAGGYYADVYWTDNQTVSASDFGEFNSDGVWVPKKYTGTYGTNGFYLDFSDGTSTTTLGYDAAGSNDWTLTNISTTAGVTYDWMTDTPTNNYCTLNPLDKNASFTLAYANLNGGVAASVWRQCKATQFPSTGLWYFEGQFETLSASNYGALGVGTRNTSLADAVFPGQTADSYGCIVTSTTHSSYNNNSLTNNTASTNTSSTVFQVAVDIYTGKLWLGRENSWLGGGSPSAGTSPTYTFTAGTELVPMVGYYANSGPINFGQRPFAYTPPTGFKSLCTANLPAVTIPNPRKHFDVVTRTGTAGAYSVTGRLFQPDFAWIKSCGRAVDHALYDSVRGVENRLETNNADAEVTGDTTGLTAFNSDGYTGGALDQINGTTATNSFVDWLWKANGAGVTNTAGTITSTVSANTTAGFSVVTYTGNATLSATVGHGLGVAPKLVIFKSRASADWWLTYHYNIGPTNGIWLHLTNAAVTASGYFNDTAPTSAVVSVGNSSANVAGTMVMYCFAEIPGYSKFGSYVGNGNADGPFVFCGFRPRYVLYKAAGGGTGHWEVFDTARSDYNVADDVLWPSSSGAETASSSYYNDILSNGFKVRTTDTSMNATGVTYIFAAFAEYPFGGSNVSPSPAR